MIAERAYSLSAAERLAARFSGKVSTLPTETPLAIYSDNTTCCCRFNVMSDRDVEEKFLCREYRVWDSHIEGVFDREYKSAMVNSPQHVVFLTVLAHAQRLAYIWASHHLGFGYDPRRKEQIKMWWNAAAVVMPSLEQTTSNATQWMHIDRFRMVRPNEYIIRVHTGVGRGVALAGQAPLYVIDSSTMDAEQQAGSSARAEIASWPTGEPQPQ